MFLFKTHNEQRRRSNQGAATAVTPIKGVVTRNERVKAAGRASGSY